MSDSPPSGRQSEASSCIDKCWIHEEDHLNQSDHLPVSVKLSCSAATRQIENSNSRIDWSKALSSEALTLFQDALKDRLHPFIGKTRNDINQLEDEIRHVALLIISAAETLLPHCEGKKTTRFKDRTLSQLCTNSKSAWRKWDDSGRPSEGPLYEAKCNARKEVRKRVKACAAMKERKRVLNREHLFRTNDHRRFKLPQRRKKSHCTRLRVDGQLISDPTKLLEVWSTHFETLAQSQMDSQPVLQELQTELSSLATTSYQREEHFLDVPFSVEEVEHILGNKMKLGKASGPDSLMTEHLRYGGPTITLWLTEILNFIVESEEIPPILKHGITIPIYKGGGKDPLEANSYRGITLTSVISKVLESLILLRMEPLINGSGLLHLNQSAYRKRVSCADAIFATQEIINRYMQENSKVFLCLYDLQKAFDTVEIPVLLHRLFAAGINSKTWRILQNGYTNSTSCVRVGCQKSSPFQLQRGVRQGSVLSPFLFLLVMDPLLRQLQSHSLGLSVNSVYAGGYLHADDIRTLASSLSSMEAQIGMVKRFASHNFLKLNESKCEVVVCGKSTLPPHTSSNSECLNVNSFPVKHCGKCLGYLWNQNLSSTNMIEERILKARGAFFQFGSISAFQGDLSPTSISSIVECCVYPVLLYGVENWIMSQTSLHKLENFQGEIAKRILKFPKWFSNTAAKIALGWPSMHSICTIRKLKFLSRVVAMEDSISRRAFCSLVDDIESLCLVRECRELEERYSVDYTSAILASNPEERQTIVRDLTHAIQQCDQALLLQSASDMEYLCTIASVVKWGSCPGSW